MLGSGCDPKLAESAEQGDFRFGGLETFDWFRVFVHQDLLSRGDGVAPPLLDLQLGTRRLVHDRGDILKQLLRCAIFGHRHFVERLGVERLGFRRTDIDALIAGPANSRTTSSPPARFVRWLPSASSGIATRRTSTATGTIVSRVTVVSRVVTVGVRVTSAAVITSFIATVGRFVFVSAPRLHEANTDETDGPNRIRSQGSGEILRTSR